MFSITKVFEFSAAHRLIKPELTVAQNQSLFGKCASENFHGHNYSLEVTLYGDLDPQVQMVVDTSTIRKVVEELVLQDLDHKNLNLDVPWLSGSLPTTEVVARAILQRIKGPLKLEAKRAEKLVVTLIETRTIRVSYEENF